MNFGSVSNPFAVSDGVSLEPLKWAAVLERAGHCCEWFSGLSDRPAARSLVDPEPSFGFEIVEQRLGELLGRVGLSP